MKTKIIIVALLAGLAFSGMSFSSDTIELRMADSASESPTAHLSLIKEMRHSFEIAFQYLLDSQLPNGSWKNDPAITSLALSSFLLPPFYNPDGKGQKAVEKGLQFLEGFVKPDGGIYRNEYRNYVTAVCLLAFTESGKEKYSDIISNAKDFLIRFQIDEGEDKSKDHPFYGGIGYGGDDRPDLSNTQLALEAIKAAEDYDARYKGLVPESADDLEKEEKELGLHWKKALVFLARCQNDETVNDMAYAADDGGFMYETGIYKKDRSHSYGSMTYAGVKSLLYARVGKDDRRVKRAVSWIEDHYTLEENPGFGNNSLYYYYMTFAKCLDVLGKDRIMDKKGEARYWREDLLKKLISLQHEDGYWINENGRYWENIKDLATSYSLIAMKFALRGLK